MSNFKVKDPIDTEESEDSCTSVTSVCFDVLYSRFFTT